VNPISFVRSIGGAHLAQISCIDGKQKPYKFITLMKGMNAKKNQIVII